MPRRSDIHRVLIIGSGPIVIGQACEFDYSGTQACKALREEGIHVVLVNSNPATIMTDPEFADRTYIEPVTPETIDKLLAKERQRGTPVDSLLPTLGGQTGLNCALRCHQDGILDRHGVRVLGASPAAIEKAEDRLAFRDAMLRIGLDVPRSRTAASMQQALDALDHVKLPCVIRPAFTLGGSGGGFARTRAEFDDVCRRGLEYSPIRQVLVEESLWGWKEFELEVMRDRADNVVIVCSIENFDPMGVHTGDSITVAPAQTLSDREYQRMRDAAIAIIREIGVETGGSNIQFAVDPASGRMCVIEMNPRVSRSSALASKATGFPIARIATKLAVGYTLDEIPNDITRTTPACFEPAIDYCVVKIPRWTFEKFPEADETLTTQMKSVGEGMAIGRTFKEALQKCVRSMEIKRFGLGLDAVDKWLAQRARAAPAAASQRPAPASAFYAARVAEPREPVTTGARGAVPPGATVPGLLPTMPVLEAPDATAEPAVPTAPIAGSRAGEAPGDEREARAKRFPIPDDVLIDKLSRPAQGRLYYIRYALKQGWSSERVASLSHIDPWFLDNIRQLVEFENDLLRVASTVREVFRRRNEPGPPAPTPDPDPARSDWHAVLRRAKQWGYSDVQLAHAWTMQPDEVRALRDWLDVTPVYKLVDTCAAEFDAATPYYYSSYETPVRMTGPRACPADDELRVSNRPKVIVLGGGPNRIGQGIEFDYCCVHAAMAARELGYEAVMVNSNPETVSTDFDTSDLLFFEPLTHEDVLNVCERLNDRALGPSPPVVDLSSGDARHSMLRLARDDPERDDVLHRIASTAARHGLGDVGILQVAWAGHIVSVAVCDRAGRVWHLNYDRERNWEDAGIEPFAESPDLCLSDYCGADTLRRRAKFQAAPLLKGVVCQFGGQTPLNLAMGLEHAGVPILGTSPASIHLAEDRAQFADILRELGLQQPPNGVARTASEAAAIAERIGYPVLVRPSFVLGGRAMEICNTPAELRHYMNHAADASGEHPVLIDRFLDDATEVDVDAVCDGQRTVVCGVLEHIEQAGIHSGDSSMSLPPFSLSAAIVQQIRYATERLAERIGVVGLMNVQFAIKDEDIYVLEVNPRASRTIPFVAKATGVPWARIAAKVMLGKTLHELGVTEVRSRRHVAVKMSVFPFNKFPGVDVVLGPEMRSTGEVMGVDERFSMAFAKAQMAASLPLPMEGRAFVSVNPRDRPLIPPIAHDLARLGFELVCTHGTGRTLRAAGLKVTTIRKIREGSPHPLELIESGQIALVINTPGRVGRHTDEGKIRAAAALHRVPIFTTITGARAAVSAIGALKRRPWSVYAVQDLES